MAESGPQAFTTYGWITCLWVLIVSFQYGYHISALNQIQAVLTCRDVGTSPPSSPPSSPSSPGPYGLPTCIPMTDATFSVVTAVYTIGGLLGSMVANVVMDRWGRKGAVLVSAGGTAVGAGLMGVAGSMVPLVLGRVLVGVGAGVGLCVGPIFLAEIAPSKIKGAVGVLTQFAIVIGIFVTQAMGLKLATPEDWRTVLVFSAALSLLQLIVSAFIVESPTWLTRHGKLDARDRAAQKLWASTEPTFGVTIPYDNSEAPLLGEDEVEDQRVKPEAAVSISQVLTAPELRRPLTIVCFSMLCQQTSGVNAVLYYSNDILSKSLPDLGPYVSLGITIVNVIMTFPPIFLIERMGRKSLLTISIIGATVSLLSVGFGLDSGLVGLSSIAIIAFIASFAVGIGPVPFVMIPEVSPLHAVSALSSVGLSLNWIINFAVGLVFLPLRNILSGGDPSKEGRVFYLFASLLAFCSFVLLKVYRG
ncbi:general substrate transporter [Cristinia sonorae]|uniref:General substrate transporter n=1 Tax=Cristinia sonorae TaxID=1940300 RepID=A0A8K0XRU9_9AGAR|nr:general substrate transporter [Cristinia sonorae]